MNFEKENKENYSIIRSKVEKLDTNYAPELKSELVITVKEGIKHLIIDLSETRYCDSSGLSAILVANRLTRDEGGTFVLSGLQDPVMKLVKISQLHTVLNITPTVSEAEDFLMMEMVEKDLGEEKE